MAKRKRFLPPNRTIQEAFLVICEGTTEETYVSLIKNLYHAPIRIISKVAGQCITQSFINKQIAELKLDQKDKITTFLMYDMDVKEVNRRFETCRAELLLSNPCIELWFLLHTKEQTATLSSDECIRELKKSHPIWKQYNKGTLSITQQQFLWNNRANAITHAKALKDLTNPSSGIYILLERIETSKQNQNPTPCDTSKP